MRMGFLFATLALGVVALVLSAGTSPAGKWDWQTGSDSSSSSSAAAAPKPPRILRPIMFNEPDADVLCSQMQIYPKENAWHWDISKAPLLKNSKEMIAAVGASGSLAFNHDMCFIIIPPDQKMVPVFRTDTANVLGNYPVPENMPIEEWPMNRQDLAKYQQETGGDRHAMVVDPVNGRLYEFYQARRTNQGWEATGAATFNLAINEIRPKGSHSADASGLPIFPSIIRFDEVERGMVEHAVRFTVNKTLPSHVFPATAHAGLGKDPNLPRMGERFRLRGNFDLRGFSPHAQAILKGLMKYGMFVADNGGNWRISCAPDPRIKGLGEISRVKATDLEVVDTSALAP